MTDHQDPLLALVADGGVDLSPLTQRLWAEQIPHRVILQGDKQCLYLAHESDLIRVKGWLQDWQNNSLDDSELVAEKDSGAWLLTLLQAPIALLFMLLFAAVFVWMHVSNEWNSWLLLGETLWPQQRLDLAAYGEIGVWALWRPTLLHFSFLHIVMNLFWWWLLARRIERWDGVLPLLVLIAVCGLSGNALQWWYAGPGFGGASGVTLGMLAWVASRQRRLATPYQLPAALLPVMVGWLLLTLMGDTLVPGLSGTAHGAHFGGLLCGLLLAWLWPESARSRRYREAAQQSPSS